MKDLSNNIDKSSYIGNLEKTSPQLITVPVTFKTLRVCAQYTHMSTNRPAMNEAERVLELVESIHDISHDEAKKSSSSGGIEREVRKMHMRSRQPKIGV